ncbi:recombinase family protein [Pseudomonas tritici]|uniref:recombinase family protein n=1 Tax=Pseudomonas tritici TaxID=2745518 RepID=UPI00387AA096
MTMKPKAYSYIRFSTIEQGRGDSERRQRAAAVEYAAQNGLDLVQDREYQFLDVGVSAYKGRNSSDEGKLHQFCNYVKDGKIAEGSYLIVESLDRLSREDVLTALGRFIDLLNEGIKIVTLTDNIVYSKGADPMQLVMSIVYMMRANEESKTKARRVSSAWQNKQVLARAERKPLGAACPYWLKYEDGIYVPIAARVEVIHKIMKMTIDGYGQTAIVKYLNSEKVPVFGSMNRNKSGMWGNSSIAKILANKALLGEYQPMIHVGGNRALNGSPIFNYYPVVVSEEMFYAALNARAQRRSEKVTQQAKGFNVWSKLAVCSVCSSPMHLVNKGKPPKGYKYLRCSATAKGECKSRLVRLDLADIAFREILAKLNSGVLVKDSSRDLKRKVSELSGRVISVEQKLAEIEQIMAEEPSVTLSRTAASKEAELDVLKVRLNEAKMEASQNLIFNKEDFFDKLDLNTYEGRSAANAFIKNSKRKVKVTTDESGHWFTVFDSEEPTFPFFSVLVGVDRTVRFLSFSKDSIADIVNQGDLTNMLTYRLAEKAAIEEVLIATDGNGRAKVNFEYEKLTALKLSLDENTKQKLLRSMGLSTKADSK